MRYLRPAPSPSGAYPAPQSCSAPGLLEFPEEFMQVFYTGDKAAAGFVDIRHDGKTVTHCSWNEEAYQAYMAKQPPPPESPGPTLGERVEALEAETAALTAAVERGLSL